KFLKKAPRGVEALLGGWQVNGILGQQSGLPAVMQQISNQTGLGTNSQRPNSNGRTANLPPGRNTDASLLQWFDTSVFSIAQPFTFGNVGRVLPDVRTPSSIDNDLSV